MSRNARGREADTFSLKRRLRPRHGWIRSRALANGGGWIRVSIRATSSWREMASLVRRATADSCPPLAREIGYADDWKFLPAVSVAMVISDLQPRSTDDSTLLHASTLISPDELGSSGISTVGRLTRIGLRLSPYFITLTVVRKPTGEGLATQIRRLEPRNLRSIGPLTPDAIARFCDLVGDQNPIHWDREIARKLGLREIVVPGSLIGCLLAVVEGFQNPQARPVRIRYHRPVPCDEPLFIGEVDGGVALVDSSMTPYAELAEHRDISKSSDRDLVKARDALGPI